MKLRIIETQRQPSSMKARNFPAAEPGKAQTGFWSAIALAALLLVGLAPAARAARPPLRLHPENPHYFQFRGKPTALITSGEHYGAVLNLDFDFAKYLDTLAGDGLNNTRAWAGAYCENPEAFNIANNTLAPLPGRFICPWARSDQPGYANGGNKFDLSRWDEAYFKRLREFMTRAGKRGVVVEMNLFCPFYEESMWKLSPMNAANNINGIGAVARTNVYTLDQHGGLLPIQEAMVRKIVGELKGFDNLYYEICNEPYFGGVTLEWQHRIADVILDTERRLGVSHLISQNIANDKARVVNPHPGISIFNFHYATPPDTVGMNYDLNKVIGDNETGFRGTNDTHYRIEAWDFLMAGGGLYNNLDYSFVVGREDGTFVYPATQPGGGNPEFRRQIGFLSQFFHRLDFTKMGPDNSVLRGNLPPGVTARALVKPGRDYAIYIRSGLGQKDGQPKLKTRFAAGEIALGLALPKGAFKVEWWDTKKRAAIKTEKISGTGGALTLGVPAFEDDIALRVRK
jgi:hypothetical protein